ncbi:hypothetical protein BASA61_005712 [Batrachochytrium salamandrivorans]|nr:hypothetical protein BASA60_008240 [Batrachochytrium salamandrivorans]KAH6572296.1 hypothetical protein BASA62_003445 [Batrachochytrium salamandrivorans]KAH6589149.1 hypothetical protein BASA61_005712 [Batrachochytrium salamandrivorans]KAH9250189.1 hypothetical protein BASA81_011997 [Batrachochytrium salamandrivorans]KAH9273685.1 hypothetical protein BASA83_004018 [Batrachochytrium salamandrivorans]
MSLSVAFVTLLATSLVSAGLTVDPTDTELLSRTIAGIARKLSTYYVPNYRGAVPDRDDPTVKGRQWFESGIMWGAYTEHAKFSRDGQFLPIVTNALSNGSISNLDVGNVEVGSFLGADQRLSATMLGRWNDDILWYGLAAMTCSDIFGKEAMMPRSKTKTYFAVALKTYEEVMQQNDPLCGGGIFWSRDRKTPIAHRREFKSVITNVQTMILASKLTITTGDPKYVEVADELYRWLQTSRIITPELHVWDGVLATKESCRRDAREFSYNTGMLLGGLAYMYKATNKDEYMNDIKKLLPTAIEIYSENGIIRDLCEDSDGVCTVGTSISRTPQVNQVPYKSTFIRGLMYVYTITTDQDMKAAIKRLFDASWAGMMKTCNREYSCSAIWTDGEPESTGNFHHQIVALELANAMASIYINPTAGEEGAPAFVNPVTDFKPPSTKGSATTLSVHSMLVATVVLCSVFATLGFF